MRPQAQPKVRATIEALICARTPMLAVALAASGCFGPTEVTGNDSCERAHAIDGDGGDFEGSVSGHQDSFETTCHETNGNAPDTVFSLDVEDRSLLIVEAPATNSIEVRADECGTGDYLLCATSSGGGFLGGAGPAYAEEPVDPGRYYIHLDTSNSGSAYDLSVDVYPVSRLDGGGTCDRPGVVSGSRRFFAGDSSVSGHHATGSCGGTGAELIFRVETSGSAQAFVRLVDVPSPRWRLYSRAGSCTGEEIWCTGPQIGARDEGWVLLEAGTNYVFVDTEIDEDYPSSGPVEVIFEIDPI